MASVLATVRPVEVVLLGTASPRGWPEPGCACASCATAVRSRTSRAPACALLDGVLLVDGHDGLERSAARAGRDLGAVRDVLLTAAPEQAPRWLDAVGGTSAVRVLVPAAGLDACRTLGGRFPVTPVSAGDRHRTAGGLELRAVEHGPGLAWEVAAPDGERVICAPGSGALRPAGGPAYDLALLGLGRSPGRAGPAEDLPSTLAQLRRDGLVDATTQVCAVGHGHDADRPDVLQQHLDGWGVDGADDGTVVVPGSPQSGGGPAFGRTLVLGGVRSGKSALAERLLAAHPDVTYVATGGRRAGDAEWQQRVAAHRARRPATWRTVETTDLASCLRGCTGAVLVDCLGTWLTAQLDQHGVWEGAPLAGVEAATDELLAVWRGLSVPVVAVSNEVGSGVVPATPAGRLFRDLLGRLNAQVAAESERVLLTVAGVPLPLRA